MFNLRSWNPLKLARLVALTISDHALSVSQVGAGFGCGLSKPTPPVNKNLHTVSSIKPLFRID